MNKQIEELAVLGCTRNPQAHTVEECIKCEFKNGMCNAYSHAKKILEYLTENAVVLTREEYDDYQDLLQNFDNYLFEYRKFADGCIKDARKETVKEILDKVDKESSGQTLSITNLLRKQYGV